METYMSAYIDDLLKRYSCLSACRPDIERAFEAMASCYAAGRKALVCGNGGSAADAEHWAGELLKEFNRKRPLSAEWRERLGPELGAKIQGALPMIPLTGFPSFSTAFGNDVDPCLTFAQLTWALGFERDVLIGLSTSGNSGNVLAAMQVARAKGMTIIGLTGKSGGRMTDATDICICVPSDSVPEVQELHLPIYHCLAAMLEERFFSPISI